MAWVHVRNAIHDVGYRYLAKPIFFQIDPEKIHDFMLKAGEFFGKYALTRSLVKFLFFYEHPLLKQEIKGIAFSNPLGLAAGFDKDVQLVHTLPAVGFGHMEVGSITAEPCEGNPKPRVWRMPEKKSLIINYGLKNKGSVVLAKKLAHSSCSIPLGISIAKTNCKETADTEAGVKDYVKGYTTLKEFGQYITINISCPNAYGGEPFTDPEKLEKLLHALQEEGITKPLFLKISPDLSLEELDALVKVVDRYPVTGFICSNLTKTAEKTIDVPGGVSGKAVQEKSDVHLKHLYATTNYMLIGCGGIFTAEDAYKKIRNGASLLQMITGMIFEGPQVLSKINSGLVELLKKDGFSNISEAIGVDVKKSL